MFGPFLAPWSPALSCVSSFTHLSHLALTIIDGDPGGKLGLGLLSLGQRQSHRCLAHSVLKLGPFPERLAPALSCVSSSAQVVPPEIDRHRVWWQGQPRVPHVHDDAVFHLDLIPWVHGGQACVSWPHLPPSPHGAHLGHVSSTCTPD
ncbi:uncharacterized protein LOC128928108 isoform X1 [Callithrix jacchus]